MGAQRASTKDVLEAVNSLGEQISGLVTALTKQALPAATPAPVVEDNEKSDSVPVDKAYLAHMTAKAAEHATAKGCEVVLYARRNKSGENKLAYALRDRFDEQVAKQPSCLGAVGSFQP